MAQDAETNQPNAAADFHDPLPEGRWLFRRITIWVAGVWLLILISVALHILDHHGASHEVLSLSLGLEILLGVLLTYYLVAPSAEHIVRLVQAGVSLRSGVLFQSQAAATNAGAKATTTTTVGKTGATVTAPPPADATEIME